MAEIEEVQQRLSTALERLAQGLSNLETVQPAPAPEPDVPAIDPGALAQLQDALDEEKLANAQLEERVRRLRETHAQELAAAQAAVAPAPALDVTAVDAELQQLRKANEMLRTTNEDMRAALAANVGEPHLINQAMLSELEALRAARASEQAETHALLNALAPLLDAAQDTPTTGGTA